MHLPKRSQFANRFLGNFHETVDLSHEIAPRRFCAHCPRILRHASTELLIKACSRKKGPQRLNSGSRAAVKLTMRLAKSTGLVLDSVTARSVGRGSGRCNVFRCQNGFPVRDRYATSSAQANKRVDQTNRGASRKIQVNSSTTYEAYGCRFSPPSHSSCFGRCCAKPSRRNLRSAFSRHPALKCSFCYFRLRQSWCGWLDVSTSNGTAEARYFCGKVATV